MTDDARPAESATGQPGIQVVTQYVKDLSFENPNAPESLVAGWPAPETSVQVFLGHKLLRDNAYECKLQYRIEAKKPGEDRTCFIMDIHYGALVVLHNVAPEAVQPVMMVEVPKLLFPFVRETVASLSAAGGYPPLYLAPVSFEAIYVQEMQKARAANTSGKA